MRPLDQLHTVTPYTPVMEALETMGRDDVNQLPVMADNHLEGVVTRATSCSSCKLAPNSADWAPEAENGRTAPTYSREVW